ncbi:growth arrest-specific protein 1-like [Gymnogyps californianus]|uniref:growth arrest-specific protein 1-like n=1 Tax=Gymnogyps californianus TaxID=33616 RepID=UPI0021C9AC22|nr:growth arrest-specific protein 1-like [Gymnogyps californianus]
MRVVGSFANFSTGGSSFSSSSTSASARDPAAAAAAATTACDGGPLARSAGPWPAAWLWLVAALGTVWLPWGLLVQGQRLICWQALLQCQGESECSYAYNLYAEACAPVLLQEQLAKGSEEGPAAAADSVTSSMWRCPSHCIVALIQLNHTQHGPALEECDCAQDETCRATKRAIEPCLPHTSSPVEDSPGGGPRAGGPGVMGCTEARQHCDWDSWCSVALSCYMTYCGKLFNGLCCTTECRAIIKDMLDIPKAVLLNDCMCDGLEWPICESVKENMARLCFGTDMDNNGTGSSDGLDRGLEEYYDENYEEYPSQKGRDDLEDNTGSKPSFPMQTDSAGQAASAAWALLASILLPLLPRL